MTLIKKGNETDSRWIAGLISHPLTESLMNVKYILAKPPQEKFVSEAIFRKIKKIGDVQIYRNMLYLPMGITYQKTVSFSNFETLSGEQEKTIAMMLGAVVKNQDDFKKLKPLNMEKVNESYQSHILMNKLKEDTLTITQHNNNRIEGSINLSKPKILFLSIPFDPGWSAKVNGQSAELKLVNVGFMGLMLPKGNHVVELTYLPPYFYEGWLIFFIGLILYIYLVWRTYGRKIKHYFNGIK